MPVQHIKQQTFTLNLLFRAFKSHKVNGFRENKNYFAYRTQKESQTNVNKIHFKKSCNLHSRRV